MVDIAGIVYLNGKYMYRFICVDLFSKYAYGIEMPNKNSDSTALVLRDVLNKIWIPKAVASDDGGEFKGRFKDILDAEIIDHITMSTHLWFIDRFTRTIKHMLFERVQFERAQHKKRLAFIALKCN